MSDDYEAGEMQDMAADERAELRDEVTRLLIENQRLTLALAVAEARAERAEARLMETEP